MGGDRHQVDTAHPKQLPHLEVLRLHSHYGVCRFSYCAISCLSLLGRLDAIHVPQATAFIARCRNFDGGFGSTPGGESHAGQSTSAPPHPHTPMVR